MADSNRPARRLLTLGEAQEIAEDLRHDRRARIEDVRFPDGFELQVGSLHAVSFANCHIRLTVGGGMLRGGVMEDCRFVDTELDRLTVVGAEMRSNTFERVTVGTEATSTIEDTMIEGGSLRECRLQDVEFRKSTLRGVSFERGRLERVRFSGCTLTETRVGSSLHDVTFEQSGFEGSDLSESDAVDVSFDASASWDLRLPERRTSFFVTPAAVVEAISAAGLAASGPRAKFEDRLREVVRGGRDAVAMSERLLTAGLGARPDDATRLIDALFAFRLAALGDAHRDAAPARR